MIQRVEAFIYNLLVNVFNAQDSAPLAIDAIIKGGSYDVGAQATKIADPADWTEEKIRERAASLVTNNGPEGDFDD